MRLYPKNPIGPFRVGIIVFLGVFMVDPAMIFPKGKDMPAPQVLDSASGFQTPEALLSREDILLP